MRQLSFEHEQHDHKVVAAGFVRFPKDGGIVCEGRSESLEISSRGKEDVQLIREHQMEMEIWH
jgi:hypothetical protein